VPVKPCIRYRPFSGRRDNRKVANSAIDIAISPDRFEPYIVADVCLRNAVVMVCVDRDECDQRIVKYVARKADLLFCKPDVLSKSRNEDSHKRASMLLFSVVTIGLNDFGLTK